MLTSITLQNFKSFGAEQTVPLRPISVLVGPNNSGKSSFLSVGRFVRDAVYRAQGEFYERHGGRGFLFHRPPVGNGSLKLGWSTETGSYETDIPISGSDAKKVLERFKLQYGKEELSQGSDSAFELLKFSARLSSQDQDKVQQRAIAWPLAHSRDIKLSLEVLRQDSVFSTEPSLGSDGSQIAAVLSLA